MSAADAAARPGRRGMTLIEVLLALVILGVGLIVLVSVAGRCLGLVRQARNYETARELVARVELEHPIVLEEDIEDVADTGDFEDPAYAGYRWERTVEPVGLEEIGLYEIRTTVYWSDRRGESSEQVVTLLHAPDDRKPGTAVRR